MDAISNLYLIDRYPKHWRPTSKTETKKESNTYRKTFQLCTNPPTSDHQYSGSPFRNSKTDGDMELPTFGDACTYDESGYL